MKHFFLGVFSVLVVFVVIVSFYKTPEVQVATVNNANEVYENNVNGVVTITNIQEKDSFFLRNNDSFEMAASTGTGFVIDEKNGTYYALTNYHVIEAQDKLEVLTNTSDIENDDPIYADVVDANSKYDVALISFKTNEKIDVLEIAPENTELTAGDVVYTLGSPYGSDFQGSMTQGIISSAIREMEVDGENFEYIQTDAAINPGNSGGPMLNEQGQVIGINSMKISDANADNIGFAIPINTALRELNYEFSK